MPKKTGEFSDKKEWETYARYGSILALSATFLGAIRQFFALGKENYALFSWSQVTSDATIVALIFGPILAATIFSTRIFTEIGISKGKNVFLTVTIAFVYFAGL